MSISRSGHKNAGSTFLSQERINVANECLSTVCALGKAREKETLEWY